MSIVVVPDILDPRVRYDTLRRKFESNRPQQSVYLELPNTTVESLSLGYQPYEWPAPNLFRHQSGFWIYVSDYDRKKRNFPKLSKRFFEILDMLNPHDGWVEASCIAAIVPDSSARNFSVQINGVTLCDEMSRPKAIRRRLLTMRLPVLVTTCKAKIQGKGLASLNKSAGYYVALDMKPLSINWDYA